MSGDVNEAIAPGDETIVKLGYKVEALAVIDRPVSRVEGAARGRDGLFDVSGRGIRRLADHIPCPRANVVISLVAGGTA
jgi:hypothetical protein